VLLEMGKAGEAAAELETAARLKPDDLGIESDLALAYAQAGAGGKAIAHFAKAEALADALGAADTTQAGQAPAGQPQANQNESTQADGQGQQGQLDAAFYDAYARALAADGKPAEALRQF